MQLGIVRRIDELGRIVIPKEMRRAMRLEVGDEMQISSDGETLSIKRASGFSANIKTLKAIAAQLCKATEADTAVSDCNSVLACEGKNKRRYSNAVLSAELVEIIRKRKSEIIHGEQLRHALVGVECEGCYAVVEPIVINGDIAGAIVLLLDCLPSDVARAYVHFCAELIAAALG